jgi:hypothetical protein
MNSGGKVVDDDDMTDSTDEEAPAAAEPRPSIMSDRARLILLSFTMLFLELALIRWSGSNVLYLSYFSNFVLLGSFLGIGIGFLRANQPRDLSQYAPVSLAALVLFVWFAPIDIKIGGTGSNVFIGGNSSLSGLPREVILPVIFILVAVTLAFIAEGVARTFSKFEPLDAYKYDLMGSILGIIGFSVVSFLRVPPIGWGLIVAAVFVAVRLPMPDRRELAVVLIPLVLVLGVLGRESLSENTYWSPYYKVKAVPTGPEGNLFVFVNRIGHQLHQEVVETDDDAGVGGPLGTRVYDMAKPADLDEVLIIGAGGGNDVAAALMKGAKHVDAVEIDPKLYELGKAEHPNKPYDDPRVDIHIDDGRAFLERTNKKYDLILLALPDSLTLVSGQSSLRLESYLFTKEALATARQQLTPDGAFAMYNYYREDWLTDRFAGTLNEVYGETPCESSVGRGDVKFAIFVASNESSSLDCPGSGGQLGAPRKWEPLTSDVAGPATDDHPFPYLREDTLPTFYVGTILLILLASLLMIRGAAGSLKPMLQYADLFFMGLAFLLLQTKGVVQFALLFGTTWFVNALVFLGVLISVLIAVFISQRFTIRRPEPLYVLLFAGLVLAWVVPLDALLELDVVPRFIVATAVAFLPIFTANLVFAQRFKDTASSTTAFGANLLGAMVGGLLEYSALIVGYRSLLIFAALAYGLAFYLGRRHTGVAAA